MSRSFADESRSDGAAKEPANRPRETLNLLVALTGYGGARFASIKLTAFERALSNNGTASVSALDREIDACRRCSRSVTCLQHATPKEENLRLAARSSDGE